MMEGSISGGTKRSAPWLLLSHREGIEKQCFYSLSEETRGTASIPELVGKCVVGSGHGWLVLVDHNTNHCCLWNPLASYSIPEMIELPHLDNSVIYNTCVMSKPPTDPDCCILFICTPKKDSGFFRQAFCRVGDDEYVTLSLPLMAAVPFQGNMYGVETANRQLVTVHFDFTKETLELRQIPTENGGTWKLPDPLSLPVGVRLRDPWMGQRYYLIKSEFELLLVHVFDIGHDPIFKVFRMDFNRMECVQLELIGDRSIFLGPFGCGLCVSGPGPGIEANRIFYTLQDSSYLGKCYYYMEGRHRSVWVASPDAEFPGPVTYWVEDEVFSSPAIRSNFLSCDKVKIYFY